MATISKGIELYRDETKLENLQEIPELGGDAEAIEVTVLSDEAHMYTNGIKNYGDSLAFKFLYDKDQFTDLAGDEAVHAWKIKLPDGLTCSFSGTGSVKLDGVGVNAALTYTLGIKPTSAMSWGAGA